MPVATVKSNLQRSLAMVREKVTRTLGEVTICASITKPTVRKML
jgi:hypothetical protein